MYSLPTEVSLLLVEDDEIDQSLVERELCAGQNGYSQLHPIFHLTKVVSLQEALDALERGCFDLVLLDLTLPDSRGVMSVQRVLEQDPLLPVVVLSGVDDEELALQSLHEGAQDYLVKGTEGGSLARAICYAIQRRSILAQLEEAEAKSRAGTKAKSAFLANMSHEIRTPLTAILGFAEIALEYTSHRKQEKALLAVRENGEHLLHVINDILDISKIEAGKFDICREEFELFPFCYSLKRTFGTRAKEKGISFGIEYCYPLPKKIVSDAQHLKQILYNLIGNAVKFTEYGGVKVVVRAFPAGEVRFDVIDTGIGISAPDQEHLFDPFTQADGSTTRPFGGTGLGLNISRRLAKSLGGDISVESEEERGSTFSLCVPGGELQEENYVTEPPEYVEAVNEVDTGIPSLRGRALVADDVPENREILAHYLQKCGVEVCEVEDGAKALEKALQERFDIILLDMQMPVLDGYGCVQELRERGVTVPVLAVTASALNSALDRCLAAGCSDYMTKPFRPHEFYDLLTKYLPERSVKSDSSDNELLEETDPAFQEIVRGFVRRLPQRRRELSEAFDRKDLAQVAALAHKLAGADLFGYKLLGNCGKSLEQASVAHDLPAVQSLWKDLQSELDKICD
ncbi:response regulator [bacterium]|nr:response regulator [bacterium]